MARSAGRTSGVQAAVSNSIGRMPFVSAYMRSSLNASAVDYAFLDVGSKKKGGRKGRR